MDNKNSYLIIEDDPAIRLIHKDYLYDISPSCEIYEAENAAQGLCLYFEKKPYMVLLDMMMPYMGGDSFLDTLDEGISNNLLSTKPRIIVITAIDDVKRLMSIGKRLSVEAVISKPISQKQLSSLVEE